MPTTAWATTATVASLNPFSQPASRGSPIGRTPKPSAIMTTALGRVKPTKAASAPRGPPRIKPRADPRLRTGRPRQELTERDQVGIGTVVHPTAFSRQGFPEVPQECAMGPPKDVQPSIKKIQKIRKGLSLASTPPATDCREGSAPRSNPVLHRCPKFVQGRGPITGLGLAREFKGGYQGLSPLLSIQKIRWGWT